LEAAEGRSPFADRRSSFAWFSICIFALLAPAGCSGEYERADVAADSRQAAQLRAMIDALRSAPADRFDAVAAGQIAGGLDNGRAQALRATLARIAKAPAVRIKAIDRFGKDVYRAALEMDSPGGAAEISLLLVAKGDKLLWAGPS
jgi:predicted nucleic acid-binding protein